MTGQPPRPRAAPRAGRLAVLLLVALGPGACSEAAAPVTNLEIAAARWAREGALDYQFVLDRVCECLVTGPVLVTVADDEVVGAQALEGSSAPGTYPDPSGFPSVDQLFEQLRSALDSDPLRFEVSYDDEVGFPVQADVDVSAEMADDEILFTISDYARHERLE